MNTALVSAAKCLWTLANMSVSRQCWAESNNGTGRVPQKCLVYCTVWVIREQIQNMFITQTGSYSYTPHFPSVLLVPLSCSKILSSPENLLLQLIIFPPTTHSIWNRCGQFNGKWMSLRSILDMHLFYRESDFTEDCGTEWTESKGLSNKCCVDRKQCACENLGNSFYSVKMLNYSLLIT